MTSKKLIECSKEEYRKQTTSRPQAYTSKQQDVSISYYSSSYEGIYGEETRDVCEACFARLKTQTLLRRNAW